MSNTEIDALAKKLAFEDEKFMARLGEKTVQLLRKNVQTLRLIETPETIIVESLARVLAAEVEAGLSREHSISFLRRLADALEKSHQVTVQ